MILKPTHCDSQSNTAASFRATTTLRAIMPRNPDSTRPSSYLQVEANEPYFPISGFRYNAGLFLSTIERSATVDCDWLSTSVCLAVRSPGIPLNNTGTAALPHGYTRNMGVAVTNHTRLTLSAGPALGTGTPGSCSRAPSLTVQPL